MSTLKHLALTTCMIALTGHVMAHEFQCGDITVTHPYAAPSLGVGKVGAVYFVGIKNKGKEADQLMGARTEASATVEIHEMAMEGDVMKMREVPELLVPVGAEVSLKKGQTKGNHLMLMGLTHPLKEGDKFPVTLKFKRGGECLVNVLVEAPKGDAHTH